jgi:hypothetical protein
LRGTLVTTWAAEPTRDEGAQQMREERRLAPRRRVEYPATVVLDDDAPRYCLVTEMSDGGVRINAIGYKVPDEFGLRFPGNGPTKSYKVIWRIGHDVGARLIDPPGSLAE